MSICDFRKLDRDFQRPVSSYDEAEAVTHTTSRESYEGLLPWGHKVTGYAVDFGRKPSVRHLSAGCFAVIETKRHRPGFAILGGHQNPSFKKGLEPDIAYERGVGLLKPYEFVAGKVGHERRDYWHEEYSLHAFPANTIVRIANKPTQTEEKPFRAEEALLDRYRNLKKLSRAGGLTNSDNEELASIEERLNVIDANDPALLAANARLNEHIKKLRTIAQIRSLLQTI